MHTQGHPLQSHRQGFPDVPDRGLGMSFSGGEALRDEETGFVTRSTWGKRALPVVSVNDRCWNNSSYQRAETPGVSVTFVCPVGVG